MSDPLGTEKEPPIWGEKEVSIVQGQSELFLKCSDFSESRADLGNCIMNFKLIFKEQEWTTSGHRPPSQPASDGTVPSPLKVGGEWLWPGASQL